MAWYTDPARIRAQRKALYSLLGDLPEERGPVTSRLIATETHDKYTLHILDLQWNDQSIPAYFTLPKKKTAGRIPAILYNHSHGGQYHSGKDELTRGISYVHKPSYAEALASLGIGALSIDAINFGERSGRSEGELFKQLLWHGQVLWGLMVYDSLRAFDFLYDHPDIDNSRIGTLGMSMGSTMSWWVAALEPRIKLCVDLCALSDFQALIETDNLKQHSIYYYVPSLLKHFTAAEINALIAPRPHLSLAGNFDPVTPPHGLDRIDAYLQDVYAAAGAPEAWKLLRYDVGHLETAAMRKAVMDFLADQL